jgi:hypothetical protein
VRTNRSYKALLDCKKHQRADAEKVGYFNKVKALKLETVESSACSNMTECTISAGTAKQLSTCETVEAE